MIHPVGPAIRPWPLSPLYLPIHLNAIRHQFNATLLIIAISLVKCHACHVLSRCSLIKCHVPFCYLNAFFAHHASYSVLLLFCPNVVFLLKSCSLECYLLPTVHHARLALSFVLTSRSLDAFHYQPLLPP